jgi:hypothetical protein
MGLLISHCTNKKWFDPAVEADALTRGPVAKVGRHWVEGLRNAPTAAVAGGLYKGRSHLESRRAALLTTYPHLIVSAGLGLIPAERTVPSYGATLLKGQDDVLARLDDGTNPRGWWTWLQANSPFAVSLAEAIASSQGPVLLALTKPYLDMIAGELSGLADADRTRLRIFCGVAIGDAALAEQQMPYDSRLNGPDSDIAGTRSNFAARALHHFCRTVLPAREEESAAVHAQAVRDVLATWQPAKTRRGLSKSDAELRAVLAEHWDAHEGRATRLLRLLRDDLGIACEQARFAQLARSMREERGRAA